MLGDRPARRIAVPAMKCILCLEERPSTIEHVFPGGSLCIDRVCDSCNSYLGAKVDCYLTDHWITKARRCELGLRGKSGQLPSAPLRTRIDRVPGLELEIGNNRKTGAMTARVVNPVIKRPDGGVSVFALNPDDPEQMIGRMVERGTLGSAAAVARSVIHQPTVTGEVEIDQHDYRRAILKIAYQLAHRWLGERYLSDAVGAALRAALRADQFTVDAYEALPFLANVRLDSAVLPGAESLHIAFLLAVEGTHILIVQVFGLFQGVVQVCSSMRPEPGENRGVVIDPATGELLEGSDREVLEWVMQRRRGRTR